MDWQEWHGQVGPEWQAWLRKVRPVQTRLARRGRDSARYGDAGKARLGEICTGAAG